VLDIFLFLSAAKAMEDEPWIETESWNNGDDNDDPDIGDLFSDPEPYQTFVYDLTLPANNVITRRIVLEGLKEENGQTIPSTGLTMWRAAPILTDFLVENPSWIRNKRVLELGAGLGLCGIAAEFLGAKEVFMTDGDTDTLAQLRVNVKSNACTKVKCPQLRWGHRISEFVRHFGRFHIILAADIIYVEDILEPLFDSVVALMEEKFFLAYARRNVNINLVLECAERHNLIWTAPEGDDGVFIFEHETLK
jgi:predicted nicotinamide N-methyase